MEEQVFEAPVVEEKPVEKKPVKKRKRNQAKRKKVLKLTKFDKDLMSLARAGKTDVAGVRQELGVHETEFSKRLEELVEAGFLVKQGDSVGLGLKGYNALKPKLKQQVEQQEKKPEKPVHKKIDVFEVMEKYGPEKNGEVVEKTGRKEPVLELQEKLEQGKPRQAVQEQVVSRKPLTIGSLEKCELCRTDFKLGVGANPKFGHCFCGAAYHKDCFQAQMNNTGHCVRCGSRLKLKLDKQSEEALKSMKELF